MVRPFIGHDLSNCTLTMSLYSVESLYIDHDPANCTLTVIRIRCEIVQYGEFVQYRGESFEIENL